MPTTTDDLILGPLNEEQREAVVNIKGPVLILAGAGSGKTRALTHRIAYLIEQGVPAWQILSVTFTNKAAKEMKERIKNLLHLVDDTDGNSWQEGAGRMPMMGTFHSVCLRILRRDIERLGRDRTFVIYDTDDQERLMKLALKELRIEESELKPKAALGQVSRFKSEAILPGEAQLQATTAHMQLVTQGYARYQKLLREHNALDFDDLILEVVRLFNEHPDLLERYQNTWKFLHVDEYQDTNHAQYLLINLLARRDKNLCVIGDPDQSIYGFRGADIRNILEFQKDYPEAKSIKLERNYRSTQPILTGADAVISVNPNRPEKHMWTDRKDGALITVHETADERAEADAVIKAVKEQMQLGIPLKEQAILYRTHAQSRMFEEACMRSGIPYRILGGVKFYARREVKDVLGYLHVILNPYDAVSLLRIINVPARKIGDTTLTKIQEFAQRLSLPLWDALERVSEVDNLDGGTKERIKQFVHTIHMFKDRTQINVVSHLTLDLLEAVKMEKWLRDDTEEGEQRWQNVQELVSVMHKYDQLDAHTSLTSFLEEVALVSEVDKLGDGDKDALTMMTLHLCKGLEFDHVLLPGCEEGIFPHSSSAMDREQLEEERRLMYVGMTRAKTKLQILFAQSRMLWGERRNNSPSRFLDDLPAEVTERRSENVLSAFGWSMAPKPKPRRGSDTLEPFRQPDVDIEFNQDLSFEAAPEDGFAKGTRVIHPTFGPGKIMERRGDIVEIAFDMGKTKSLALSIAPLRREN